MATHNVDTRTLQAVSTLRSLGSALPGNPMSLTKADVGLPNVDNTSDENKPVSTAQATAINAKYTKPAGGVPLADLAAEVQNRLPLVYRVSPTGGNVRQMLQQANDDIREAGGGIIELDSGAVYTLDATGLIIDIGAGVGIRGNGAYIDARSVTGGTSALTLTSRQREAGVVLPGVDTDTRNFYGKRASVEGFMLMGSSGIGAADGIDVNMNPIDGGRAPRATVRNVVTQGFYRAIRHRNKAYLCEFENGGVVDAEIGLSYEGGSDQGENTVFRSFAIGNCNDVGILIDCRLADDPQSNVNLRFEGCSIDYNNQFVRYATGLGQCRFINGYFEWMSAGTTTPFDLSATAPNRMLWVFDNCDMLDASGTKLYSTMFKVGSLHDVRINDPWIHNIGGAGIQATATGSPTAGPTYFSALAEVTGTGRFKIKGISDLSPTTALPRTPTAIAANNMLADGGFEQTTLSDAWYGTGGVGTLSTVTTDKHTGARSLQVPITTAVNTAKSIRVAIPRANGARFVGMQGFAKLSAGSGSISSVVIVPALITGAVTVGTAPTIVRQGTGLTIDANRALSAAGWTNFGTTGSISRPELPDWCNYILLYIDLYAINNSGGNVYFDDLQVEQW